ncbi:MAG: DUF1963 domain-containing protein [Pseudomonadota bacterium]
MWFLDWLFGKRFAARRKVDRELREATRLARQKVALQLQEELSAPPTKRPRPAPPPNLDDEAVEAILRAEALEAIYLRRHWPPTPTPSDNGPRSRLGGLPQLARGSAWPRRPKTGRPYHFLAQIDCAELPTLEGRSPLPRDGLLLFFADLDEEMLFDDEEGPKNPDNPGDWNNPAPVIYVPAGSIGAPAAPPEDLPPSGYSVDRTGRIGSRYDGPSVFPAWPVSAHRVTDYPWARELSTPVHPMSANMVGAKLLNAEIATLLPASTETRQAFVQGLPFSWHEVPPGAPWCVALLRETAAALPPDARDTGLAALLEETAALDDADPVPQQLAARFSAALEAMFRQPIRKIYQQRNLRLAIIAALERGQEDPVLWDLIPPRFQEATSGKLDQRAIGDRLPATAAELEDSFPYAGGILRAYATQQVEDYEAQNRAAAETNSKPARDEDLALFRALQAAAAGVEDAAPIPAEAADVVARLRAWLDEPAETLRLYRQQPALARALVTVLRRGVTEPKLRARLPDALYEACSTHLAPHVRGSHHLMLGASQRVTNPTQRRGTRLLVLDSDLALDFMFCDCGVVEYWISLDRLVAKDFRTATASTNGG